MSFNAVLGFYLAQIFPGNYDRFMVVTNRFLRPIKARFFRIHPVTWRSWISMRVEFFGCIVGKRLVGILLLLGQKAIWLSLICKEFVWNYAIFQLLHLFHSSS